MMMCVYVCVCVCYIAVGGCVSTTCICMDWHNSGIMGNTSKVTHSKHIKHTLTTTVRTHAYTHAHTYNVS